VRALGFTSNVTEFCLRNPVACSMLLLDLFLKRPVLQNTIHLTLSSEKILSTVGVSTGRLVAPP
jgi:hypothetical protein